MSPRLSPLRASIFSLALRACAPLAASACLLLGCQSDAERARELLEGPGAGAGVTARDALVQATTLDPTLREAWVRLADVELAASRWVEADAAAQRAIALSDTTAHEHEVRARALVALERWADAEPEITREIALGAPEAAARTRLGKVQEHLERPDDAIASYRRAIELEEGAGSVEARCALARVLITRLETASHDESWQGDDASRTEIRALLEGAREPAAGTPFAEEVTSLVADLSALDERATQLAALRSAREQAAQAGILALLGEGAGLGTSPFATGGNVDSGLGSLFGDQIGDAFGFGGLGLSGIG
jgi:tetratricopeptide (TPR) repeat protein